MMFTDADPPADAVAYSVRGDGAIPTYLTRSHHYTYNYRTERYERTTR